MEPWRIRPRESGPAMQSAREYKKGPADRGGYRRSRPRFPHKEDGACSPLAGGGEGGGLRRVPKGTATNLTHPQTLVKQRPELSLFVSAPAMRCYPPWCAQLSLALPRATVAQPAPLTRLHLPASTPAETQRAARKNPWAPKIGILLKTFKICLKVNKITIQVFGHRFGSSTRPRGALHDR